MDAIAGFCRSYHKGGTPMIDEAALRAAADSGSEVAIRTVLARAGLYAFEVDAFFDAVSPAAPISGLDTAPTEPLPDLDAGPSTSASESADTMWRRVLATVNGTAANQPDSIKEADAVPAGTDAAHEAGDRVRRIMALPEARGRTRLAQHIVMHTDLDVAGARAALLSAPIETTATATARPNTAAVKPTEGLVPMRPDQRDPLTVRERNDALWRKAIANAAPRKGSLADGA